MKRTILCISPDTNLISALIAALGDTEVVLVTNAKELANRDKILHEAFMELKNPDDCKDFLPISPEKQTPPDVYGQMLNKNKNKHKHKK